jgi:hypothetical protein
MAVEITQVTLLEEDLIRCRTCPFIEPGVVDASCSLGETFDRGTRFPGETFGGKPISAISPECVNEFGPLEK